MFVQRRKSRVKSVALGSAVAGVAGYLAGLLSAPKSGQQTRKEVAKLTGKKLQAAEKDIKQLQGDLGSVVKDAKVKSDKAGVRAKKEIDNAIGIANYNKDKLKAVMTAIKRGSADDYDLNQAIKDGSEALDHLREYLKK